MHPISKIKHGWKMILVVGLLAGSLSLLATFIFPLQYRADAQVLIISQSRYGVDPYTTVKSAERIGENIAQVMQTSDFYNKVKAQEGHQVGWSYFEKLNERQRRKAWQKSVSGSVIFGTGVLNVNAYSFDPRQAIELAGAAADTLVSKGWQYVGGDVTMSLVNSPVVTRFPVRPNLLINAIVGFLIGLLVMGFLVVRR
ncbi:MAG: hypothetical protein COX81_00395 [Candidatus Magasanikbacteria bacterium CG_4_10_14_0_2_um_filter_37_12]|uniref:Polysaccharide chain length determinant N-terminal domain-containing protein n=1 Tax=Candidatus Magasanikbacteria bacterium CG_4_10_14_0_2_um_filter_37_12 TaxID=1974637 RepID=A0A2M7V9Q5_9BACT|nr:MAG: hypothetical protein COX81_00395 [Candidatus Magasanikbacteria bacterium CG_4_10_14_0_2_um_filter_37_12]